MLTVEHPRTWVRHEFRAMGSTCSLLLDGPAELVPWARHEIGRLERCWSRFRPDSELSHLNANLERRQPVSPTMLIALRRARLLYEATGGRFDPTVLTALRAHGYDRTFTEVAARADRPRSAPADGFDAMELRGSTVRLRAPIDLGGVGKGLAADLVVEGLLDRGAEAAVCSMGGDVRVGGRPSHGHSWPIPVEHPLEGHEWFTADLASGAIVTSTVTRRRWPVGDGWAHHLIDPSTGAPTTSEVAAAVVSASEAWWAEGLAKAAIVAGAAEGAALLRRAGVTGWLVRHDATVVAP